MTLRTIHSELNDLINVEDVQGAVLFRIDGTVIDSAFNDEYTKKIMRLVQWSKKNVSIVSSEMRMNNLHKATYELEDGCIIFFTVDMATILTIIAKYNANLSLLSVESKRKAVLLLPFL